LWLRCFHPSPESALRLVFFPHAGGSATFFHPFSKLLPASIEVLAVQYPGRQDRRREECVDNIQTLAERLTEVLATIEDKPFAFFGHSMGATVAFEVARRLEEKRRRTPVALMVSSRCAPSDHRSAGIHKLTDEGVLRELRRLSGTNSALLGDEELVAALMPAIRSDYRAAETYTYVPGPPLSCPIVGFTGTSDPRVEVDDLLAWSEHTDDVFELCPLPGGHFYLVEDTVKTAKEIEERLVRACV
jgi:surfactin synthase thioesterase subunit